jgi:TolA-binding protein
MKKAMLILFMFLAISLSGCSGNRAAELFETAQFEEVQNNQEHAKQLYSEIIAKYPESEYAKKAKERLSEL